MRLSLKMVGEVAVLRPAGTLIGGPETDEVRERLRLLVNDGVKLFVLDLSRVRWMNSHGMGMLMACYSTVNHSGGNIVLANLSEKVEDLMNITKVNRLFELFPSVKTALHVISG